MNKTLFSLVYANQSMNQEEEKHHVEETEKFGKERTELEEKLQEMEKEEEGLRAKVRTLALENVFLPIIVPKTTLL